MKNFFTSMLGALVALLVFFGGCFLLFIGYVAVLAAAGGNKQRAVAEVEHVSYLVFDLGTAITDAPQPADLPVFGNRRETLQTRSITHAIHAAATDSRIAGIYITGDLSQAAFASGYAS